MLLAIAISAWCAVGWLSCFRRLWRYNAELWTTDSWLMLITGVFIVGWLAVFGAWLGPLLICGEAWARRTSMTPEGVGRVIAGESREQKMRRREREVSARERHIARLERDLGVGPYAHKETV
jgi:hypothetical protein